MFDITTDRNRFVGPTRSGMGLPTTIVEGGQGHHSWWNKYGSEDTPEMYGTKRVYQECCRKSSFLRETGMYLPLGPCLSDYISWISSSHLCPP